MSAVGLYQNVPEKDYLSLFEGNHADYASVVKHLDFKKEDVALATGTPVSSIRYDHKIPKEVSERITEWANLLNLVAQHFKGDVSKTILWFTLPNPLLGNITPRDMIRLGRYKKLLKFIMNALSENR